MSLLKTCAPIATTFIIKVACDNWATRPADTEAERVKSKVIRTHDIAHSPDVDMMRTRQINMGCNKIFEGELLGD